MKSIISPNFIPVLYNPIHLIWGSKLSSIWEEPHTEYSIAQEQNITPISKNVESWDADFKFIYKGFVRRNEAFMNLGVVLSKENSLTYSYYLDESEVVELRDRLVDAVEELKKLGMKWGV